MSSCYYPMEDYRFPQPTTYDDYYDDENYYTAAYATSSFNRYRNDRRKRHSISEDQYDAYDRNRDYYEELKYLKKQLKQQARPRSPFARDTQNSLVLDNSQLLLQPSSYVNYPMMINDPMMSHGLGARTTEPIFMNMVPPPMIYPKQPYFFQIPNNHGGLGFPPPFPNMLPGLINNNQFMPTLTHETVPSVSTVPKETEPVTEKAVNNATTTTSTAASAPAPATTSTTVVPSPAGEKNIEPSSSSSIPLKPLPQPLQRRRSMMESILSAFALPNAGDIVRPHSSSVIREPVAKVTESDQRAANTNDLPVSPSSGMDKVEVHLDHIRSSSKLHQTVLALKSRQHVWVGKFFQNGPAALHQKTDMWITFDVKNQAKIDSHYMTLKAKHGDLPDDVLVLTRQSQVPGPLYISIKANKAWYNASDSPIVFDIRCLPTASSQFILPPMPEIVLKRSKSLDITTKMANLFKS